MEPAKVPYGTRSDEKNQLKHEGGHTKWVQKKTRPIEDQRLNEDGAAIAEAVALHVLLDEDNIVLKKDVGLESGDSKVALLQFSLEELGWDSDVDGHWPTWSNSESCDWNISSDPPGRDLQPQFFEEEGIDSIISDDVVAEKDMSSLQIGDDMQADTNVLLDGTGKVKFQKELDEDQALSPLIENFVNPTPLQEVQDKLQKKRTVPQKQISQPQRGGNTRFFHSPKMSDSQRNAINRMKDRQIHGRKKKGEKLRAYFQNMFASANPDPPSELEELISPVVTMEENEALCSIPTALEIKEVVNKMDSWKFPGPDGRPAFIYKAHWDDTIGQTLVETVQRFFSTGHLSKEMNAAYLIFIPKNNKHGPFEDRENFRPLTICNVAYKVISKIMNNRLRPLLDKTITPLQSAFVPNRSISDEATIVSEMVNYMIKKKGNKVYMALKLKMEDAYHLTEWPFLFEVMRKHGFSEKWLLLEKQCISTASLSILINGVTYGNIILKRGLREGDPISPSLFIIAADVLSRLIVREEHNGTFHGT
ncbi:hypothetical protein BUALT_Bualt06G0104300 [Buddleja alternifolia]|uniref:Reverse transcriptase domain-containing protein n=1 Tax=Buddleja alternifolia TaxID=168488 RepID=A0AAV6XQ55_9LAMI|nr:hypothetical protein BUALT_Bualt06G0104300 [Buddleja alternifolia]